MKKLLIFLVLILAIFFGYYYFQAKKTNFLQDKQDFKNLINKNTLEEKITSTQLVTQNKIFLEIISPKNKQIVNERDLIIQGVTVPFAEVYVAEQKIKADREGNFSLNYQLEEGENELIIVANDDFGNFAEKFITVDLQTEE